MRKSSRTSVLGQAACGLSSDHRGSRAVACPWFVGAEAECKALKEEFKKRGLTDVAGDKFTVTACEQIAGRLDTTAVKAFLGDSYSKFEKAVVTTVVRIKAANRLALTAAA